jgi:hypothetical protein
MERLWFVTNPASGSSGAARRAAIDAVFAECGLVLASETEFPRESLPDAAILDRARVDTLVLFAGDGTINAALCALADWPGDALILPGGTMNLLAKALHGSRDPATIVRAAHAGARRTALPCIEAGPHRAFVGLILGPAAHWARAREAARRRRWRNLVAAARNAWRRTFARGIRLTGVTRLTERYQAVLVAPAGDALSVAAIDARDWRAIGELGWGWLSGDWLAARAVTSERVPRLGIHGHRAVLALFDGEPVLLDPDVAITAGETPARFLTTQRLAPARGDP